MRCGCGHLIVNNEDTCVECRHNKSCHHTFSSVEFRRKVSNLMINTITSSSRYYPDPGCVKRLASILLQPIFLPPAAVLIILKYSLYGSQQTTNDQQQRPTTNDHQHLRAILLNSNCPFFVNHPLFIDHSFRVLVYCVT